MEPLKNCIVLLIGKTNLSLGSRPIPPENSRTLRHDHLDRIPGYSGAAEVELAAAH